MLERYPNMYADLSGYSGPNALKRDEEFGRQYIIDYADRLLWVRDNFDRDLWDHITTLDLRPDVYGKIAYRNAEKLLGDPS